MKKAKVLVVCTLIAIILFSPVTVRATAETIWAHQVRIMVNGEIFEPWGFTTEGMRIYLCLFDIAYLFNGTSAQFNIRTPIDDRWDFWIIRGEAYTPTNTEFQPMESIDYWGPYVDSSLVQSAIIGIDGEGEPAISLVVSTIQDGGGTYFDMPNFASILGFDYVAFHSHYHFCSIHGFYCFYCDWGLGYLHWPEINAAFTTETREPSPLPIQPVELLDVYTNIIWDTQEALHSNIESVCVDANEVLDIPPEPQEQTLEYDAYYAIEPYESLAPPQTPPEENRSRIWVFLLPILIAVALAGFALVKLLRGASSSL